ncbi:28S ribosomal protein S10, mitochondrial [Desmophyllum pertusum]|uniref:28S ribosomal protein S10, mitochondrial n=1 Tax=Desmophyllum pertusum TaxID=174260 RepID=A0A9W9YQX9_9CNID|nr:28S ribosomal protein S10, mitochondrial [Desmophyllum pertusum]
MAAFMNFLRCSKCQNFKIYHSGQCYPGHAGKAVLQLQKKLRVKQENPLVYSNLLIKLEGLDDGVLDHFCQFVTSASKMMNLEVNKKKSGKILFHLLIQDFGTRKVGKRKDGSMEKQAKE